MIEAPTMSAITPPEETVVREGRTEYAGFWRRFVAYIIDSIILGVPGIALFVVLILIAGPEFREFGEKHIDPSNTAELLKAELQIWPVMVSLFVFESLVFSGCWLYFALMESSRRQGTLGKRAMGLIVTDPNGYPITFGRATGRYFAKMVSAMTFGIGYIIAGFTSQKQALHDLIASTVVLRLEE